MKKRAVTAVLAVTVALTIVATATMAQGAPAETFRYSDCSLYGEYEFCFEGNGVFRYGDTPSGNQAYMSHGSGMWTFKYNGVEVASSEYRQHFIFFRSSDGEPQVYHSDNKLEATIGGETCIVSYNATYANGALRHEVYDMTCS